MLKSLNYAHLKYFWHVAREENLTKASKLLRISQSALSHQIKELEIHLGHELFHREHRGLRLTTMGHLVLDYTDSIFLLGSELLSAVESGKPSGIQSLTIGSVATLSRNFFEAFLHPILSNPVLRLSLFSASNEELLERLLRHQLQLVLTNQPITKFQGKNLECKKVGTQEVCLIGPPNETKESFTLNDLTKYELILPGHTSSVRTSFDILCNNENLQINVFAEIDDMALLRLLAKHSRRAAIAPAVVVQEELARGELSIYGVIPDVLENFYAVHLKSSVFPPLLSTLLNQKSS